MMKQLNRMKNKKGFTLIELIVVLAILGVILAIAVPRYTGLQADAESKADDATKDLIINSARLMEINESLTPQEVAPTAGRDITANGLQHGETVYLEPGFAPQSSAGDAFVLKYSGGKYIVDIE